jgi:trehalose 6-phosphate phosphatase
VNAAAAVSAITNPDLVTAGHGVKSLSAMSCVFGACASLSGAMVPNETNFTIRLERSDALFFDFDGTLTEIVADPDAVALAPETALDLVRLAPLLDGAVAIVSGRDIRDLAARVPAGLWRIGSHGTEICRPEEVPAPAPSETAPAPVIAALHDIVSRRPGVRLEIKGPVAALHFRAAPEAEAECLGAAHSAAAAVPGYAVQPGKMVVEVKPATISKGAVVLRLMEAVPFAGRRPIVFGDDTTDETAFEAVLGRAGLAIKVGEGATVAPSRMDSPARLRRWISDAVKALTGA